MKPLSPGINLASQPVINQWDNINDLPIVGTSPRNVPMSTMIDFPQVSTEIYGGDNLDNLKRISDLKKLLEKDILVIYQIRSRTAGLKEEIDGKIPYEKYSQNVIQMLNDFQQIYQDLNNHSTSTVSIICQILSQSKIWNEGYYYGELLDQMCFLIYKLFALNYIYSEKTSIIKDIDVLISLLDGHDDNKECVQYIRDVQKRFTSKYVLKDEVIRRLIELNIEPQLIKNVFNVFWRHIEDSINKFNYIRAENETAYIISLLFFVDIYREFLEHERQLKPKEKETNLILYSLPENVYSFLHRYREDHPYLVLIFELSVDFDQFCSKYNFAEKEDPLKKKNKLEKIFSPLISLATRKLGKKESNGLNETRDALFNMFQLFSQSSSATLDNANPPESEVEYLLLDLVRVLQSSNFAIHSIREFITLKYKLAQSRSKQSKTENLDNSANENGSNNENANVNDNNNNENTNNNDNNNNKDNDENANDNKSENGNNDNNSNTNENANNDNSNNDTSNNKNDDDNENSEFDETNKVKGEMPRSYFEIAMKDEIQDDERNNIMKILTICCLFHELILTNYTKIYELLSKFIINNVDEFIQNSFTSIYDHSKPVFEVIKDDIDQILELTSSQIPTMGKEIFLIKLLRAKVQQFVNPESKERMTGKGNYFTKGTSLLQIDTEVLNNFLKKSSFYIDILQFERTLSTSFDQSTLYFKETFLDSYRSYLLKKLPKEMIQSKKTIYFPLTTSIPFMLINLAIERAETNGELVGTLFYPFSIYDDAANVALNVLESKMLYDEILAESTQTLLLIIWSFSHYAFNTVKTYLTKSFVDERLLSMGEPKSSKSTNINKNSIMRIKNFLQQSQLFIVGHHIDMKSNITKYLEKIFIKEIVYYLNVVDTYGISSIFVFSSMMQIYRKMHTFFIECEAPITNFDELMQIGLGSGASDSFSSKFFESINENLFDSIIPDYAVYTNPYRLFSQTNDNEFSLYLRSNQKNSCLPSLLGQTIDGISIKHFKEVLLYINDGGMYKILLKLKEMVVSSFNKFIKIFRKEKFSIHRIKDIPLGAGSNNAFSNFEKIYGSMVKNKQIDKLFLALREVGNIIVIAEMIDDAYALKSISEEQFLAYLFMCKSVEENPEKILSSQLDETSDHIFKMFGKQVNEFKKMFKWEDIQSNDDDSNSNNNNNFSSSYIFNYSNSSNSSNDVYQNKKLVVAPKSNEVLHPFKQVILKNLMDRITSNDVFVDLIETSTNPLDFSSLTGFASIWSVLEFVFCLKECYHNNYYFQAEKGKALSVSPLAKYGESVLIPAAIILISTNQVQMFRVFSIGEQIYRQSCVENSSKSNIVSNFLNIYDFVKVSTNCILSTLKPAIGSIEQKNKE